MTSMLLTFSSINLKKYIDKSAVENLQNIPRLLDEWEKDGSPSWIRIEVAACQDRTILDCEHSRKFPRLLIPGNFLDPSTSISTEIYI